MTREDVIGKSLLKRLAYDMATYLLELQVKERDIELLDTQSQRVEARRADLVARMVEHNTGERFLLHIEIQNDHDPLMPWRMLRYLSDIKLCWPHERVRQYLVFIGDQPLHMADGIDEPDHRYRYRILDMRTIDCERLMAIDKPDALVLAILCDFKGRSPELVVNSILRRLFELLRGQDKQFRDYLKMLEILSENRHLEAIVERGEQMLTQVNEENLPSFRIGLRRGIERGMERGMDKGAELARLDAARNLLDILDDQEIARRLSLPLAKVRQLREE